MAVSDLVYIDSAGYHYADYPSFLAFVQSSYQGIYGADVYLGADSMDGQWTAILAQALYDTASVGAQTYNSFSPATAQGVGLSRVVKINGLERDNPTYSSVVLTIVGVAGTTITNGIAFDTINQQWILPATVTIPDGGSINVTAYAQNIGAIQAEASTVTGIFTPTLGWQTVNNSAAAVPGAPVETDAQLRIRQSISTSNPAQTVIEATTGALANLPGVTNVQPYENATDSTDGNGLPPHSVCFVVQGGVLTDITNTIGLYKTPGTNTYASGTNAQNTTYYDAKGLPVPINFYNPAVNATISVEITITPLTDGWSTDFEPLIAAALAAQIETGGIGSTVLYTKLFVAAYDADPIGGTFDVISIEIKKNAGSFSAANIDLDFTEIPICDPVANVSFTIT